MLAAPRIHDDLVDALAEQARGTGPTAPADQDAAYGPLNNPAQLERVGGFVDRLPDHARLVAGGSRVGDRGFLYEPTVVAGLERRRDEPDEVFGPVITVQRFADEDEAVRWANASSTVWRPACGPATTDGRCEWPGGSISVASGSNTHIPLVAEMPHGGFKSSGHGKDLSVYGLEDYTRIKHVMSYIGH